MRTLILSFLEAAVRQVLFRDGKIEPSLASAFLDSVVETSNQNRALVEQVTRLQSTNTELTLKCRDLQAALTFEIEERENVVNQIVSGACLADAAVAEYVAYRHTLPKLECLPNVKLTKKW